MKKLYKIIAPALVMLFGLTLNVSADVISTDSILTINIKAVPTEEQEKVNGSYTVSSNGYVNMPWLNAPIKASGLTGTQLSRKIEKAYITAEIYSKPLINVITSKDLAGEQIDAKIVSVGGNVQSPGPKAYARGMTLFQAVNAAGGANAFGAANRVELMRNGERHKYNMKNTEDMQVLVYPGDTINMPAKNILGR
ncbi:polysaccharide biosynthesis/export family protein [Akkermansiaceae bacterium]|nr:polysaccharide biosynthesis/export family protein [Akkermansiaceae bacterium]